MHQPRVWADEYESRCSGSELPVKRIHQNDGYSAYQPRKYDWVHASSLWKTKKCRNRRHFAWSHSHTLWTGEKRSYQKKKHVLWLQTFSYSKFCESFNTPSCWFLFVKTMHISEHLIMHIDMYRSTVSITYLHTGLLTCLVCYYVG